MSKEEAEKLFGPSRLRVEQARTLFHARRYAEAEAACKQALAASPKFNGQPFNPEARRLLAEIYLAQGRYPEASDCFSLVRRNTSDVRLDLGLALAYCRAGKLDLARQCFSEKRFLSRIDISPLDLPGTRDQRSMEVSILFARGLEAYETGQHDEAIQEFTAAERLAPTNGMIAYFHAYSLRFRNRGEEAYRFLAIAATYAHGKAAKQSQLLLRGVSQAKREELGRWAASLKKQPKAR
jgi:tetratricopeptide (TPR) repeat protein